MVQRPAKTYLFALLLLAWPATTSSLLKHPLSNPINHDLQRSARASPDLKTTSLADDGLLRDSFGRLSNSHILQLLRPISALRGGEGGQLSPLRGGESTSRSSSPTMVRIGLPRAPRKLRCALFAWESLHTVAAGGVAPHVTELAAGLERCVPRPQCCCILPWGRKE